MDLSNTWAAETTRSRSGGQRVELGEIEENIVKQKGVPTDSSCVLFPRSGPFAHKLTAVIVFMDLSSATDPPLTLVADTKSSALAAEMRDALSKVLPVYMVPEAWITVSALPLSSTGKKDRKAIGHWVKSMRPELQQQLEGLAPKPGTLELPQNNAEEQLRSICCDILNIPTTRASMNKSFIALGGRLYHCHASCCQMPELGNLDQPWENHESSEPYRTGGGDTKQNPPHQALIKCCHRCLRP